MEMDLLDRIIVNPEQCGGRAGIRHLRIRVADILSLLGYGATHREILTDYPMLTEEDILAALRYAATQLENNFVT